MSIYIKKKKTGSENYIYKELEGTVIGVAWDIYEVKKIISMFSETKQTDHETTVVMWKALKQQKAH